MWSVVVLVSGAGGAYGVNICIVTVMLLCRISRYTSGQNCGHTWIFSVLSTALLTYCLYIREYCIKYSMVVFKCVCDAKAKVKLVFCWNLFICLLFQRQVPDFLKNFCRRG